MPQIYKQAAGLRAVQTMEERFAYGLTPKKLGAVERGALFFQIRQAFPHGFPLLSVSEHEKTPQTFSKICGVLFCLYRFQKGGQALLVHLLDPGKVFTVFGRVTIL